MNSLSAPFPDAVLEQVRRSADLRQTTPEQYVSQLVAEGVRQDEIWRGVVERGQRVSRERYLEILDSFPDVEPEPWDRIE